MYICNKYFNHDDYLKHYISLTNNVELGILGIE